MNNLNLVIQMKRLTQLHSVYSVQSIFYQWLIFHKMFVFVSITQIWISLLTALSPILNTSNVTSHFREAIVCDSNDEKCMSSKCSQCGNLEKLDDLYQCDDEQGDEILSYFQLETVDSKTVKIEKSDTVKDAIKVLKNQTKNFLMQVQCRLLYKWTFQKITVQFIKMKFKMHFSIIIKWIIYCCGLVWSWFRCCKLCISFR